MKVYLIFPLVDRINCLQKLKHSIKNLFCIQKIDALLRNSRFIKPELSDTLRGLAVVRQMRTEYLSEKIKTGKYTNTYCMFILILLSHPDENDIFQYSTDMCKFIKSNYNINKFII